jgi:predicted permease
MPSIVEIVLPTFAVITIGYLIGKLTKISISSVVDITLYIGVPALVFISLLKQKIVLVDAIKIWMASLIIMLGCLIIAWLVFKILRQRHSGLYVPIAIMNTMNMPFPIISLAYGDEGMIAATLFYISGSLVVFSLGIFIMARKQWKENVKEIFKQPAIYASILGLLLNFLNTEVPELLTNSLNFIAMMTIPLVLLILGYNLSKAMVTALSTTLLASFLRIGIGLAIGFLAAHVLNITGVFRSVVVLDSAMPSAAMSSILAAKYRNEAELVASVVFLTTLASLVVIPLLLHILG